MPSYAANWHHALLAAELDKVLAGETQRLMIFMPPQHGKSELASRRLPTFALGQKPDEQIIACSYADSLASANNRACQRIIDSEDFDDLFPVTRLAGKGAKSRVQCARTSDYFEIVGHRGYYRSAGVGGGITGRGATLAIVDDPFKGREEANSPVIRQKVWDWFTNDLATRVAGRGRILLIMTRWHRDDLAGRLLRQEHGRWRVISLPALRLVEKTHPDDPRDEGDALWPCFKDRASLEREREMDRGAFAALYQQDPSEVGETDWSSSLFREVLVSPERFPSDFRVRIVACDPSKGKSGKSGDYTAMIFLGFAERLLWVDAVIERLPMQRITSRLVTFCDEHHPDALAIEAEQFQEFLCHDLERATSGRFALNWKPSPIVSGGIKKEVRIRRLSPYIVDRKIRVKDTPGGRLLVEQLMDFPTGKHDDGPDALEMAIRLAGEVCGPA